MGTMIGDALGSPLEGSVNRQESGLLTKMIDYPYGKGRYTDDTQMTIALSEAFLQANLKVDQDLIADKFGKHFDYNRGYARIAANILNAISCGIPWRDAVKFFGFADGSYGNGAAMRVAPVSLAFCGDEAGIKNGAAKQSMISGHHHPDGIFGAQMQALIVNWALQDGLENLEFRKEDVFKSLMQDAPPAYQMSLDWIRDNLDINTHPKEINRRVKSGVLASQAVCAAFWFFLYSLEVDKDSNPIVLAVNYSWDADTVGAMTGAIAGAYYGAEWFKLEWVNDLENGAAGKDYILSLADQMADAWLMNNQPC